MQTSDDKTYLRRRRWWVWISTIILVIVAVFVTWFFNKILSPYLSSAKELRAFLEHYGWQGRFILLGIQCIQVLVALIPGEAIELGAGYAYGAVEGMLICLVGIALSSSLIFLLVKKCGTPLVEIFIPREKIRQLRFINTSRKLKRLVFLLFFIPGTPKDLLTYFVGLTDMNLGQFLCISLIARIPSIVSSTISGQMLGDENYLVAVVIYGITGVISIAGYWGYSFYMKRHHQ